MDSDSGCEASVCLECSGCQVELSVWGDKQREKDVLKELFVCYSVLVIIRLGFVRKEG